MAEILRVVLSARKGGCGKTVVAALVARELARHGRRVLVLDLDPQRVGVSLRLGAPVDPPLPYTAVDLVLGPSGRPFSAHSVIEGRLDLVPANQRDLAPLERLLAEMHERRTAATGGDLRRDLLDTRLAGVEVDYDFVLVDTPTGFGEVTTNALEAADVVLSPIDMSSADNVESLADLQEHLEEVKRQPRVFFIPNKYVARERQSQAALARARVLCRGRLLERALLPSCAAVAQAMAERRDFVATSETAEALSLGVWRLGRLLIGLAEGTAGERLAEGARDPRRRWLPPPRAPKQRPVLDARPRAHALPAPIAPRSSPLSRFRPPGPS